MASKKKKEAQTFPDEYRIFSADLSLKRPGFCKFLVRRIDSSQCISELETMSVDNKAVTKEHGEILDDIFKALANFIPDDNVPMYFIREKAALGSHPFAMIGMAKVCGLADWLAWRMKTSWHEVAPMSIKKLITGNGKAQKIEVANEQSKYIGEHDYVCDDESDAAAAAVAWLIQEHQLNAIPEKLKMKENDADA